MAALAPDDIRTLEQTRQRLQGLQLSLAALQNDLLTQQPLPSWASLQSHASLISSNLQALTKELTDQQRLLSSLLVYPLPTFPNAQAHILEQMLRTKLEPDVEDWVEEGYQMLQTKPKDRALPDRDRNELWQWAADAMKAESRKQIWGGDYTLAEKEQGTHHVVTGLKRDLVEPPSPVGDEDEYEYEEVTDDEEDEGDDPMDVVEVRARAGGEGLSMSVTSGRPPAAQMSVDSVHKFMTTGKFGTLDTNFIG